MAWQNSYHSNQRENKSQKTQIALPPPSALIEKISFNYSEHHHRCLLQSSPSSSASAGCGRGFTPWCCGARTRLTVCYRKPFLFTSLRNAGKLWFLKSFVCLLSMIGEGESPQRSCGTSAPGKKEKHVQKNKIVIYGGWIWPMEPKSFRCVCPSHWPKTLSSVFPNNLPKIELNSCIDRFLSCAVPHNQGYSSCISVQCVHPPRWASSSPWSSKPQWDGLQ